MAQTLEAKVKQWLRRQLLKKYPDAWIYMAPGGPFGRRGVPDLLCCIKGLFVIIEAKSETGKLTANQTVEINKLRVANAICAVIHGKDAKRLEQLFKIIDDRLHIINRGMDIVKPRSYD